jgi:integrase
MTESHKPFKFRTLPVDQWPTDCQQFLERGDRGANPFASRSSAWHRQSSASRKLRLDDLGIFLDWLIATNRYRADSVVADQVAQHLIEEYYADLEGAGVGFYTKARRLIGLYVCLRTLSPKSDWNWLLKVGKECERIAKATKEPPDSLPLTPDLAGAGIELLRRSADVDHSDLERAVLYRDGLLICFLAFVAPRRHALHAMSVSSHLTKQGETWVIEWPPEDIKGRRRGVRRELPHILGATLERYFEVHHRVLMAGAKNLAGAKGLPVWATVHGSRMSEDQISKRVKQWTEEILGVAVNVHAFRHSGATTLAVLHPEHIALATSWLGHASPDTAASFYILAESVDASTRFTTAIDALRFGSKRFSHER